MKSFKFILLIFLFNVSLFASFFSNDENIYKDKIHYKNSVELAVKEKVNELFNDFKNQSVVEDKNIQYYRPDPLYRRPPKIYRIWTRASVTSIDNGKFYYIIPEGYRILYEKEGEIYIDYLPNGNKMSPLNIINMNNY